ncbi:DNA polymerase [Kaistia soli DSM 19436]|uniref:DNA polymerase n=1 Tax=Kaistia soli DSM 19436 TaxID=1122133 RepID=A0A1M5IYN0_9HYPH|nr:hypothetical protein [Kaistia soli]SHG33080.1 DNA polymerase [Kaistia soli DSM 19436]
MTDLITTNAMPLPTSAAATIVDIQLAEALGYQRPTDIRKMIKRNSAILEAMGSLRHSGVMIEAGKGARREVTEYHLNRAQAAFIIAKSGTKQADNLAVKMAEVFALFSEGGLVAADAAAEAKLAGIEARETERRGLIAAEEREGRDAAFAILKRR